MQCKQPTDSDSPCEEDVEDDAQRPDVARLVVALPFQYFGGDEVSRVAGSHQQAILRAQLLGEAEVDYSERLGLHAL